jgi:hypothetical protein
MTLRTKAAFFRVVPCPEDGMQAQPPYMAHHIHGVGHDGSHLILATIWGTAPLDDVIAIAKILAGDLPVKLAEYVKEDTN